MRMMQSQWLRRRGSWAALFALVLQLVLAFGHMHPLFTAVHAVPVVAAAAPLQAPDGGPGKKTGDAAQDICAICIAIHLANTVVPSPSPPAAMPVQVAELFDVSRGNLVLPRLPPHPFHTRAPPIA